nr:MAG TPA: hypothetical protein [Bacteriophage sp.]
MKRSSCLTMTLVNWMQPCKRRDWTKRPLPGWKA